MARDPNGSNNGTDGNDILWGKALVLSDGTYDNYSDFASDALRGFGLRDLLRPQFRPAAVERLACVHGRRCHTSVGAFRAGLGSGEVRSAPNGQVFY